MPDLESRRRPQRGRRERVVSNPSDDSACGRAQRRRDLEEDRRPEAPLDEIRQTDRDPISICLVHPYVSTTLGSHELSEDSVLIVRRREFLRGIHEELP